MSALAIHPSPRTRGAGARRTATRRRRSAACGHSCAHQHHTSRSVPRLSVLPAPATASAPVLEPEQTPVAATPAQPRLRLTTRGRRVLVALGFAVSIAIGGTVGTVVQGEQVLPEQVTTVTVQPGESLWAIASTSAAPGQDVREVIDQIRALNGLEHSTVHAGQELSVPAQ